MKIEGRTMLFKATRLPNGQNVCVDIHALAATTRIVSTQREYEIAVGQGWSDHPVEAMARLESAQDAVSTDAAIRAYDDQHMSPKALEEAAESDQAGGFRHQPAVPEGPKRRKPKTEKA
jgi:hypothetical protein